jgi:hypothetical protein
MKSIEGTQAVVTHPRAERPAADAAAASCRRAVRVRRGKEKEAAQRKSRQTPSPQVQGKRCIALFPSWSCIHVAEGAPRVPAASPPNIAEASAATAANAAAPPARRDGDSSVERIQSGAAIAAT